MRDVQIRRWFGVVGILVVDVLFGVSFVGWCTQGIYFQETKAVPLNSRPTSILSSNAVHTERRKCNWNFCQTIRRQDCCNLGGKSDKDTERNGINSYGNDVQKLSNDYGERRDHKMTNKIWKARGIEDIPLHRAFLNLVTEISKKTVLFHKNTIIGVRSKSSSAVVPALRDNTEIMTIKDWNGNCKTQMERNMEVEIDEEKEKQGNWKEEVQIGKLFERYWEELFNMLSEVDSMWDGDLG